MEGCGEGVFMLEEMVHPQKPEVVASWFLVLTDKNI